MTVEFREGVALAPHTTLKVGGPAQYFCTVKNVDDIQQAVSFAQQHSLPVFVLGGGSNVLVPDSGLRALVMQMDLRGTSLSLVSDDDVELTAAAGEVFDEVVALAVEAKWWGLENLSHIPGSIGATPIQNVGAYGVEVGALITQVAAYHVPSATKKIFSAAECQFGYRDSFFKTPAGREYVITAVTFRLKKKSFPQLEYRDLAIYFQDQPLPTIAQVRRAVIKIRSQKFPDWTKIGTAGSFFKNPIIPRVLANELRQRYPLLPLYEVSEAMVKCSLGYILDQICGLKGYACGHVRLYENQALVLVAEVGASAGAIEKFAEEISSAVFLKTKIKIEREVTIPFE